MTTYTNSEELLARAVRAIPLGTQTFSKSKTQYPFGVSPYFIQSGSGSKVKDVDGNEYIDFVNALASVNLGYADPDVDRAVQEQMRNGVVFSLPHPIEIDVAEAIIDMVPCAEMVRFGKNGSDATTGAVRVARAFTGRDHIAACGYHGWHDWYIGTTSRNLGVPEATRRLTHTFKYNDIDSLHAIFREHNGQVAAVIMEPMNAVHPAPGFLNEVKELAHKNGAIFIFDETITGFRFANGGAQEFFNVTPDLATFGKGLANGYPLAALAGRGDLMRVCEEIFYSFTFGGETLSLAASKATMAKIKGSPVIETMRKTGRALIDGINGIIQTHGLDPMISVSGEGVWSFLNFKDVGPSSVWEIKTLFLQEIFKRGILSLGTHNISYAHSMKDVETVLGVYREVFPKIYEAAVSGSIRSHLKCEPLVPLFKVR
ncbi:MAG: aminotransferase class III-fold pyridoxal phosphate-dependent enzyme [Leptospirales bacterium]|nr:aminotransferase class III-fold pyridoxal phosphate-dependent enzyme [Leptospirales bacterium]